MLSTAMMQLGTSAELAREAGWPGPIAITAAGSSATDATVLQKDSRFVTMTATGANGIKLPADAPLMVPYAVFNSSGSTGIVYPPTSGTLNGGTATTGGLSLTTKKFVIFWRYSVTGWAYMLTA